MSLDIVIIDTHIHIRREQQKKQKCINTQQTELRYEKNRTSTCIWSSVCVCVCVVPKSCSAKFCCYSSTMRYKGGPIQVWPGLIRSTLQKNNTNNNFECRHHLSLFLSLSYDQVNCMRVYAYGDSIKPSDRMTCAIRISTADCVVAWTALTCPPRPLALNWCIL